MHSILDASDQGYKSDFMSKVYLDYNCCEELHVNLFKKTIQTTRTTIHAHKSEREGGRQDCETNKRQTKGEQCNNTKSR